MEQGSLIAEQYGEIVLYQPDETLRLEVRLEQETVWLTQAQMAELFLTTRNNITLHIRNIFKEGELQEISVSKESLLTAADGKKYNTKFYNLDVIISVGYRVKSIRGTYFRIWAMKVLKTYLLRGYSVNQQLLRIYLARVALEAIIRMAKNRVVIVDAYISALTLDVLESRSNGVKAVIYTAGVGRGIKNLVDEYDKHFPKRHIEIKKWRKKSHDRFLIADDIVYHCGRLFKILCHK